MESYEKETKESRKKGTKRVNRKGYERARGNWNQARKEDCGISFLLVQSCYLGYAVEIKLVDCPVLTSEACAPDIYGYAPIHNPVYDAFRQIVIEEHVPPFGRLPVACEDRAAFASVIPAVQYLEEEVGLPFRKLLTVAYLVNNKAGDAYQGVYAADLIILLDALPELFGQLAYLVIPGRYQPVAAEIPDGLGYMRFPGPRITDNHDILAKGDEIQGFKMPDQLLVAL